MKKKFLLRVGVPLQKVVERIRAFHAITGVGVLDLVVSAGQIPPADVQRTVELFGREVLPCIREIGTRGVPSMPTAATA